MGYRVTRNVSASGQEFKTGDIYEGPSDLIEGLLKSGVLEETTEVISKPQVSEEPPQDSPEPDFGDEENPKPKKKGKGR